MGSGSSVNPKVYTQNPQSHQSHPNPSTPPVLSDEDMFSSFRRNSNSNTTARQQPQPQQQPEPPIPFFNPSPSIYQSQSNNSNTAPGLNHRPSSLYPGERSGFTVNGSSSSSSNRNNNNNQSRMSAPSNNRRAIRKPGAYEMQGGRRRDSTNAGNSVRFNVRVPPGVRPGQNFPVMVEGQQMVVTCPQENNAGDVIQIECQQSLFLVTVPDNVRPGQRFQVMVQGQRREIQCPANVRPGDQIRFQLPPEVRRTNGTSSSKSRDSRAFVEPTPFEKLYEVVVPDNVRPNEPFLLMADGQRVTVTCPPDGRPGKKIRFKLPIIPTEEAVSQYSVKYNKDGWIRALGTDLKFHWARHVMDKSKASRGGHNHSHTASGDLSSGSHIGAIGDGSSSYSNGHDEMILHSNTFTDTLQISPNQQSSTSSSTSTSAGNGTPTPSTPSRVLTRETSRGVVVAFSVEETAFVRMFNPEKRKYEFVLPNEASIDTTIKGTGVNFQTLLKAAAMPFADKCQWFRQQIDDRMRLKWDDGHMEIAIRREHILQDSLTAFQKIKTANFKQFFRYEFIGEPGIDAGGVAREFYEVLSDEIFNPDFGLFTYSSTDQMCLQINHASGIAEPYHLHYYRFIGQLLAKALFDGQIICHHFVRPLYKHILAWPVVMKDLEYLDREIYNNLLQLLDYAESGTFDLEDLCLDFTVNESYMGSNETVELIPGGTDITLSTNNLAQYLEAQVQYRLLARFSAQLGEMLKGFYEIIPEAMLSIFDFQELELLLCGLPNLDMEDWMRHTEYGGEYARGGGPRHEVVKWFWETVSGDFNEEQRARLLQFVTGTSGVPAQGFSHLQGNDGSIRLFTINSIGLSQSLYPRAHTCFNRIDLPVYKSKVDLKQHLTLAIQMEATGFDIE